MGSRLSLGAEEVWPPTPKEVVFGYGRLTQLLDPTLRATDVIRSVSCYEVYAPLIERLAAWGYPEAPGTTSTGHLTVWPYDWRLDNCSTAKSLAGYLRTIADRGPIFLIAHSMGGLIARYALEVSDPALGDLRWRSKVQALVMMGTPHRGAPLALVRAVGLDGALGLSPADVKTLMADARYPSSYQLLPISGARACWNDFAGEPLEPVDIYDPTSGKALGLAADNLQVAKKFHNALAYGRPPTSCRYFCFVGRQEQTIVRTELTSPASVVVVRDADAGDGTVPVWSGTLPEAQFQLDGDEHGTTFKNRRLLETLGRLLGIQPMLVAAAARSSPHPRCVLPSPILAPDAPTVVRIELATPISGQLTLNVFALDGQGALVGGPISSAKVPMEGQADLKPSVAIRAPKNPGAYACVAELYPSDRNALRSPPEPFVVPMS
jgi:pimeloyl-ACP methyl ester carboxylesterase